MLRNPHCLILDEPTNHLDLESREAIEAAILGFKGTVIAVSHDRFYLNQCVTRILELSGGSMTSFNGNYDQYCRELSQPVAKKNQAKAKKIDSKAQLDSDVMAKKAADEQGKKADEDKRKRRELEHEITRLEGKLSGLDQSEIDGDELAYYESYGKLVERIEALYEVYYSLDA